MQTLWQDVRYGARMLVKHPGFSLIAVLTLSLGIGANTAIFSVVNAVLLRSLPYEEADRLVFFTEKGATFGEMSIAYPNFLDWRAGQTVFEGMAVYNRPRLTLTDAGEPEEVRAAQASADLFSVLRVQPALGRVYTSDDDKPDATPVVVLSHGLWQRRFGGDAGILNQPITLNDRSYTVIGVMPKEYQYPTGVEMWIPVGLRADEGPWKSRGNHPGLRGIARLRAGVDLEQARAELNTIAARLSEQYPTSNEGNTVVIDPLKDRLVGDVSTALWVLLAAVGFVLLIACANVANLLLARAAARQREVAVRVALGASCWRIVRQLLTESVLLALLGSLPALLLAQWMVDMILAISADNIPRAAEIGIDGAVMGFTGAVAMLTGILFGLVPAWRAGRTQAQAALKESGRSIAGGRSWLRNALVVAEVALTLVLLVGAGLLIRSFAQLLQVHPGFNYDRLLTFSLSLPQRKYKTPEQQIAFFQQLQQTLATLPGVQSASYSSGLPLGNNGWQTSFTIEGQPIPPPSETPSMEACSASPDYFRTLGIPLLAGRWFDERDNRAHLRSRDLSGLDEDRQFSVGVTAIIIDEEFAKRYWPEGEALGKHVRWGINPDDPLLTVIGVVGRVKVEGLREDSPFVQGYFSALQVTNSGALFTLRTTQEEPEQLVAAVRSEVLKVDANLPVSNVNTMADLRAEVMSPDRLNLTLIGLFAGLALVLALIGIYGVMSYAVTQRTNEIGIRMALGAQATSVMRMIVGQGMRLTLIGVGIGLVAALGLTRLMAALLFGVSETDPLTFSLITALLTGVAFVACYIPARRATKVDPLVALRYD